MADGYVMVDGGLSDPEDDLDMWDDHEEWCCLAYEDHGCPCTCHVIPADVCPKCGTEGAQCCI